MEDEKSCPKCEAKMVSDRLCRIIPPWHPNKMEVSAENIIVVVAHMCPECRFVELYAPRM